MRIDEMLRLQRPTFSFEFMAPRSEAEVDGLFETARILASLRPDFVCVTCRYNSRAMTANLVGRIQRELGVTAMAHLVCVGATKEVLNDLIDLAESDGIQNILALRGDIPPSGEALLSNDLQHASDLITLIAGRNNMCIGGACFPEKHPDSKTWDDELAATLLKVESGATFLITQLFFDNEIYWRFLKDAATRGINVPILPGVMPITHYRQVARIKEMGATIPPKLEATLFRYESDPAAIREIGIAWASAQCLDLLKKGAPGIHFYTFNRSPATRAIHGALRAMGLGQMSRVAEQIPVF